MRDKAEKEERTKERLCKKLLLWSLYVIERELGAERIKVMEYQRQGGKKKREQKRGRARNLSRENFK